MAAECSRHGAGPRVGNADVMWLLGFTLCSRCFCVAGPITVLSKHAADEAKPWECCATVEQSLCCKVSDVFYLADVCGGVAR